MASQPDIAVLGEAADWILRFQESAPGDRECEDFDRWRAQSAAHAEAWRRAESMLGGLGQLPPGIGRQTLQALGRGNRREAIRALVTLMFVAPAGWFAGRSLPLAQWTADFSTAKGERRALTLDDGSQLVLNTATSVDVTFTADERRLLLHSGEILVRTHADVASRPFHVQTAQGRFRALGTRFAVRRLDDERSRIAVYEHAVEVRPQRGEAFVLNAGQQAVVDRARLVSSGTADDTEAFWQHGMLLVRKRPLAEVVAELSRYRRGRLRCDPAVGDLEVSGTLLLSDTDAALALLERNLPIHVRRSHRYWTVVEARSEK